MMKPAFSTSIAAALLVGAAALFPLPAQAGSCCGGGAGAALSVPKYARAVADLSFDAERYDGYWNQAGKHLNDPPGSDLSQYRLNMGLGYRFATDWQASITLPYIWNDNAYSGVSSKTDGLGDTTINLSYDLLDDQSTWRVRNLSDMVPGVTLGLALLLPTGNSAYDDVTSSFDVTGRGFYRLDGTLLVEKAFRPWNVALNLAYGTHFERSVNREYGKYVEPYRKQLGDRASASLALGYTYILGSGGNSLSGTVSYAWLNEDDVSYNGYTDQNSGFRKQSLGGMLTYASTDSDWSLRAGWNHALQQDGCGRNFPTTDIFTLGVRYVFL
jgi:hypothetical protein